jgi:hypothetical protein
MFGVALRERGRCQCGCTPLFHLLLRVGECVLEGIDPLAFGLADCRFLPPARSLHEVRSAHHSLEEEKSTDGRASGARRQHIECAASGPWHYEE